jgi:hypothetical protein
MTGPSGGAGNACNCLLPGGRIVESAKQKPEQETMAAEEVRGRNQGTRRETLSQNLGGRIPDSNSANCRGSG